MLPHDRKHSTELHHQDAKQGLLLFQEALREQRGLSAAFGASTTAMNVSRRETPLSVLVLSVIVLQSSTTTE